jgi:hypothetical protein
MQTINIDCWIKQQNFGQTPLLIYDDYGYAERKTVLKCYTRH